MKSEVKIGDLIEEFLAGGFGKGVVLFHKRMHKKSSGEFACLNGIVSGCENYINCSNCLDLRNSSHCLRDNQEIQGFLVVEEKHRNLVERGAPGAYASVREALADKGCYR